jgi:uncharacterized repeat protein (TIGR01451 family)
MIIPYLKFFKLFKENQMKNNTIDWLCVQKKCLIHILTFFFLAGFFSAGVANAALGDKNPANSANAAVVIKLELKRVVTDAKGDEKLEAAPKVKPGELVEYSAVYRNRSKQAVTGLKASLPVPFGLQYVGGTAKPTPFEASVDGTKFEAAPLKQTVKGTDGKEQKIDVPLEEYRGLRWEVGTLEAGKKVVVKARMRVIDLPKSPAELVKQPVPAAK